MAAGPLQQEQHGLQRVGVNFHSSSSMQSANGCECLRLQQTRQQEETSEEVLHLTVAQLRPWLQPRLAQPVSAAFKGPLLRPDPVSRARQRQNVCAQLPPGRNSGRKQRPGFRPRWNLIPAVCSAPPERSAICSQTTSSAPFPHGPSHRTASCSSVADRLTSILPWKPLLSHLCPL